MGRVFRCQLCSFEFIAPLGPVQGVGVGVTIGIALGSAMLTAIGVISAAVVTGEYNFRLQKEVKSLDGTKSQIDLSLQKSVDSTRDKDKHLLHESLAIQKVLAETSQTLNNDNRKLRLENEATQKRLIHLLAMPHALRQKEMELDAARADLAFQIAERAKEQKATVAFANEIDRLRKAQKEEKNRTDEVEKDLRGIINFLMKAAKPASLSGISAATPAADESNAISKQQASAARFRDDKQCQIYVGSCQIFHKDTLLIAASSTSASDCFRIHPTCEFFVNDEPWKNCPQAPGAHMYIEAKGNVAYHVRQYDSREAALAAEAKRSRSR